MSTFLAKNGEVEHKWFVIDADGAVLGRLAERVANLLRGKRKPIFTPHVDTGDFVIVINAGKVRLTGKKETQKMYMTYSGWRGGEKRQSARDLRRRHPTELVEHAVKGMMPKNRLASQMLSKLKVYAGSDHPHIAQKPEKILLNPNKVVGVN